MKRLSCWIGLSAAACGLVLAETPREHIERIASLVYVHGITEEIAGQIGPQGVPELFELMRDPAFERRDNVVALLGFLAQDTDTPVLVEFLAHPPVSTERPEDHRAVLLVPDALGRIASRGGAQALDALNRLQTAPEVRADSSLARLVDHGLRVAGQQASEVVPEEPAAPVDPSPQAIDGNASIHYLNLTYSNHVNTADPITDAEVDELLEQATRVMGTEDAENDTACCVQLGRNFPGGTFGSNGDGLDVITSSGEMSVVLNNTSARIKVVDVINWCGGTGSNILGCGEVPGNGIAVVRLSSPFLEGLVWAHEFGHNTGLPHNSGNFFIMTGGLGSSNTRLSTSECDSYHFPSGLAGVSPQPNGVCSDSDGDSIVSSTDNCPGAGNPSQTNSDTDSLGNACDNCTFHANQNQADCNVDGQGDVCDGVNSPPNPIANVVFPQPNRLKWDPVDIGKHVYRGSIASGATWTFNHTLVATVGTTSNGYQDLEVPAVGGMFYYLINAFNGCGEGP